MTLEMNYHDVLHAPVHRVEGVLVEHFRDLGWQTAVRHGHARGVTVVCMGPHRRGLLWRLSPRPRDTSALTQRAIGAGYRTGTASLQSVIRAQLAIAVLRVATLAEGGPVPDVDL